jgi:hypothetical protein
MAQRPLPKISDRPARCVSLCILCAIGLAIVLGYGGTAMAQQGLKIRLVDTEQEDDSWDQRAMEFGSDALTPPGEAPLTQEPPPAETLENLSPLFGSKPDFSGEGNSPPSSPSELLPPSVLSDAMPGYLPSTKPGILNDGNAPLSSALDTKNPPYNEPTYETYEQQRFQNGLLGLRKHLITTSPDECVNGPERVWRFAPFQRVRFIGPRLFGPSPYREAFIKLFPWNRTPGRNQGVGEPLVNDSWRWAPFGFGWYMGFMDGNTLLNGWTGTKTGFFGGYHLNWDFDHYWGTEFRYGFASLPQWDVELLYAEHGFPSQAVRKRHATLKYGDFSFLYYPWGDARWRPYVKMGVGWGYVKFTDLLSRLRANTTMTMPFGIGLKYRYSRRIVFRMEMMDNFIFGERGINPQHNFSMTGGIEIRFGGPRKAYWPYNPGRHYW